MAREIGTINVCGKDTYKLLSISYINKKAHEIVGLHECWHKWMRTRNAWTKTPSYYVEVE